MKLEHNYCFILEELQYNIIMQDELKFMIPITCIHFPSKHGKLGTLCNIYVHLITHDAGISLS